MHNLRKDQATGLRKLFRTPSVRVLPVLGTAGDATRVLRLAGELAARDVEFDPLAGEIEAEREHGRHGEDHPQDAHEDAVPLGLRIEKPFTAGRLAQLLSEFTVCRITGCMSSVVLDGPGQMFAQS